jgi:hypothetical protein
MKPVALHSLLLSLAFSALSGCVAEVYAPETDAPRTGKAGNTSATSGAATQLPAGSNDTRGTPSASDDPSAPTTDPTPDPSTGVAHVDNGGPPPSQAAQSCTIWSDCGPYTDNNNSGFDCINGSCQCDATGQWSAECGNQGGTWSPEDCFCFFTSEPRPTSVATPPSSDPTTQCWWRWKQTSCAPTWVDTSHDDWVCDGPGYNDNCHYKTVYDGYYDNSACAKAGRWIKRCSNGNEYWY